MGSRVGLGFDAHPFAAGRALRLGGVAIPHECRTRGALGWRRSAPCPDGRRARRGRRRVRSAITSRRAIRRGRARTARRSSGRRAELARARGYSRSATSTPSSWPRRRSSLRTRRRSAPASPRSWASTPDAVSVRGTSSNGLGFPGRKRRPRRDGGRAAHGRVVILSRLHPIEEAVARPPSRDRMGALRLGAPRPPDPAPSRRSAARTAWRSASGAGAGPGPGGRVRRTRGWWPGSPSGGISRRRRRWRGSPGAGSSCVLDEVQDPQNLGAALRVAEGLGAGVVVPERGIGAPFGGRRPSLGRGRRAGSRRPRQEPPPFHRSP